MPDDSKKCKGCDKLSRTAKGWCSHDCYIHNQRLNGGNKGWFQIGNSFSEEWLLENSKRMKQWHKDNPEKSKRMINSMSTQLANSKKGHPGESNGRWIKDRSLVKKGRCYYEEKQFFKKILKDRDYTCELTSDKSSKLSVHHVDSVHLFPEKQFDDDNVIVIKKDIHMDFHKKYGFQNCTREKWEKYLLENYYVK